MIGFALTLFLQSVSPEPLTAEGEALGRVITVMAVCASVGYGDNPEIARGLNSDLERRALSAGYGRAVVMDAFRAGVAGEKRAFAADEVSSETSPEARRRRAVNIVTRIKQRCREVASEHPGLITDLERGEAAADARLDALIRTLD